MERFVGGGSWILASLLTLTAILGISGMTSASLQKPTYAAGDRWVYVLEGSATTFPGLNESQTGTFRFGVAGRVEVAVVGPVDVMAGNTSIPAIRVDSRAFGFLDGTFSVPGGGSGQVTGTFTAGSTEFWEDQGYLPIESAGSSSYLADVTYIAFTTQLTVDLRLNATTSVSAIPPFDLDVGQSVTANLTTRLDSNSTIKFLGQTRSSENETNVSSEWRREVLSREDVTVEAGTFAAYKLNQSLGSFPGISIGVVTGSNETAYFSNDVGFYVKRTAYANGTPVAQMRLNSYSYGAPPPSGLTPVEIALLVAIPAAMAFLIAAMVWRRRKGRRNIRVEEGRTASPPSRSGDEEGGGERAR